MQKTKVLVHEIQTLNYHSECSINVKDFASAKKAFEAAASESWSVMVVVILSHDLLQY
jgi:hypothetical protein